MLVLTRGINEVICIGPDIRVMVVGYSSGERVKLGVTAPANVLVDREEIRQRRISASEVIPEKPPHVDPYVPR